METITTEVLIIGGGVTGAGIMRDLSLRGIHCILIERDDLCAGASGGNHGLLHSGGRYVSNDLQSAIECRQEGNILKAIAPHCIEDTGGLFVAVAGDDEAYADRFPSLCQDGGIACEELTPSEAREMEPRLAKDIIKAYLTEDATIDPFRLALENVAQAEMIQQSRYLPHCQVIGFTTSQNQLKEALCLNTCTGSKLQIRADQFVNAGGGWAMKIAALAGCEDVNLRWSKGTLLISHNRLTKRVINRLRPPSDGDILVPGGTVSVLGTTSVTTTNIDDVYPTIAEVNSNMEEGLAIIPSLAEARIIRAYSRVRPLVEQAKGGDDRNVTRSFSLFDHSSSLENFCTITGGKLTTYRLMAERTADLVAARIDNTEPCTTHLTPLPDADSCKWTEPGGSPRYWFNENDPDDLILCECELVPQSAINTVISDSPGADSRMSLEGIALRTRAGKGPCQGSFCGIRITAHLYDKKHYSDRAGLYQMRDFFSERFKGMRTVIWGQQMAQMELAEALHCGVLGLDNLEPPKEHD